MPRGSELSDGLQEISVKDLSRGINFLCWWIEAQTGTDAPVGSTVAYMGANDIRYFIFIVACHKTGYKVGYFRLRGRSACILTFLNQPLLLSSKNSDEAQLYLLHETKCNRFFYTAERERNVAELKQLRPELNIIELPALDAIWEGEEGSCFYPFTQSYEEAEDEVFLIVHSSGSTGMVSLLKMANLAQVDSLLRNAQAYSPDPRLFQCLRYHCPSPSSGRPETYYIL